MANARSPDHNRGDIGQPGVPQLKQVKHALARYLKPAGARTPAAAKRMGPRAHRQSLSAAMIFCAAVACGFALSVGRALAVESGVTVDPDGTVHVSDITLPPSSYWSPQFKAAFIKQARGVIAAGSYRQPEPNAPKAQWTAFDAGCRAAAAGTLNWERSNYPVDIAEQRMNGVRVALVTPRSGIPGRNAHRVLIELRGGSCGGMVGETEAIPVAYFGGFEVLVVDYRPAPRYAYPASVVDVVAVYEALLGHYEPTAIGIFGTSGGGMLTSEVLSWLQAKGLPRPGAAGIFWSGIMAAPYPWGHFGDSLMWELGGMPRSDHTVYRRLIAQLTQYMNGVKANDPRAYPGSSDEVLRKFPTTLFLTGTRAVDLSSAVTSYARLLRLGVDADLYVMEGGWHASSYGTDGSPEERNVNEYIARWFESHLSR